MEKKFAARFKQGDLESNNGIAYFFRKQILIKQDIQRLKKLNDLLGEVKLILTKGLVFLIVQKKISLDGSQNYLVSQLISSYFTSKIDTIYSQQSKGMSEESVTPSSTTPPSFY